MKILWHDCIVRKTFLVIALMAISLTSCSSGGPKLDLPKDWDWIPAGYKGTSNYTKVSDFNVAFKNTSSGMEPGSDKWTSVYYTIVSKVGCSDNLEISVNFTSALGVDDVTKTVTKQVKNLPAMSYQQILFVNEGVNHAVGVYVDKIICTQLRD